MQQINNELNANCLTLVRKLGHAAEYRDNQSGLHVVRMSYYAKFIAESIGLNKTECNLIFHAAPLHDIGKVSIPDEILLKNDHLTTYEKEIVKRHTTIGAKIIGDDPSTLLVAAKEIALTHHEHWNGNGYPRQLKGGAIPLYGRICAIADVYDTLTTERPYKGSWSHAEAVTELVKLKGEQFDPRLLDAFFEVIPEVLMIKEQYADPKSVFK